MNTHVMRIIGLGIAYFLTSCVQAPQKVQMATVMAQCDTVIEFVPYVACIKRSYSAYGTAPGGQPVLSFYAQLDAIAEQRTQNRITFLEAKAAAYRAYDETIGVANRVNRPVTCVDMGFGVVSCH
jgi:hypothetical protein